VSLNERSHPEAPVQGQARMDVAWGANDGDETGASAQTAQAAASGEIFEQHYTPWNGTLNPRWMRNWAILRHHVLGIFSKGHRPWSMPTRIFILITFLAAMGDAALTLVSSLFGEAELHSIFGVSRDNLYGHVLGFFPRNTLYYPLIAALLVGGVISEDRQHGTSALYFSRPVSRFDYVGMKFLAVALIQAIVVLLTYCLYFLTEILAFGRGWAWMVDVFPMFVAGLLAGVLLIFTYTSIGLSLSSVSRGRFFPGIGLLAILFGTKTMASIVKNLFEREVLYLFSPYDCLAHVGQTIMGTQPTYTQYPWTYSLVALIAMNATALYILATRVASMEVTRE